MASRRSLKKILARGWGAKLPSAKDGDLDMVRQLLCRPRKHLRRCDANKFFDGRPVVQYLETTGVMGLNPAVAINCIFTYESCD